MTITRKQRIIGALVNALTFNFLMFGNLYLLFTKGTTLGGKVAGYKFEKKDLKSLVLVLLFKIVYGITLGIFWIYDILTMEKRNGTYPEKWADNRKTTL